MTSNLKKNPCHVKQQTTDAFSMGKGSFSFYLFLGFLQIKQGII